MLFSNLLNPLSQTLASQECTLAGFAEHYIQVYRSRVMINDCYHQLIDDQDKARFAQAELTALMSGNYQHAGYKVGLTDTKAQEMFAISQPLVGVLFKEMLLPDGAVIAQDSATSLLVELDLLARVKSMEINQAGSIEDVARHIDAIIPFIELPDAMFQRGKYMETGFIRVYGEGQDVFDQFGVVMSRGDTEIQRKCQSVGVRA